MKGEVVYLYAFDVARESVSGQGRRLLSTKHLPFSIRVDRTLPRYVPLYAPLAIEPPGPAARLAGEPIRLLVRVYQIGVVTITLRVAFDRPNLSELLPLHHPTLEDGGTFDE